MNIQSNTKQLYINVSHGIKSEGYPGVREAPCGESVFLFISFESRLMRGSKIWFFLLSLLLSNKINLRIYNFLIRSCKLQVSLSPVSNSNALESTRYFPGFYLHRNDYGYLKEGES